MSASEQPKKESVDTLQSELEEIKPVSAVVNFSGHGTREAALERQLQVALAQLEEAQVVSGARKAKLRKKELENTSALVDIVLRGACAILFTSLTWWWLWRVLNVLEEVAAVATSNLPAHHLSDNVLMALLTTTTVDVIALSAAVAAYLFKQKPKSAEDAKDSAKKNTKTE